MRLVAVLVIALCLHVEICVLLRCCLVCLQQVEKARVALVGFGGFHHALSGLWHLLLDTTLWHCLEEQVALLAIGDLDQATRADVHHLVLAERPL